MVITCSTLPDPRAHEFFITVLLMQLVDNNTFIAQLTDLFSKSKSSVWLTHKRLTHDGEDATMAHTEGQDDTREYPCLVRVTDGKKASFSTTVEAGQLDQFNAIYGSLLKTSMTTLRKRDKKREKQRSEQAVRRRKKMTEPVVVEGPKRGNGRRIRQRKIKAAVKQQEAQKKFREREEKMKKDAVQIDMEL